MYTINPHKAPTHKPAHIANPATVKIIADEKHLDKLDAALAAVQKRATARTLTGANVLNALTNVEKHLGIPKKSLAGVAVWYSGAEHFPSAYKYMPDSTHFLAKHDGRHWIVTEISRDTCPNKEANVTITLTDLAKSAIIAKATTARVSVLY